MDADSEVTGTRLMKRDGQEVLAVRCARLRVVRGPDQGREIELGERRAALIGTGPESDLQLHDDSVSRRHCEIRADGQGYLIRDLGSTNGIRIAGVLVREAILGGRSPIVSVGETDLQLELAKEEVIHALSVSDHFGVVLGRAPVMRQMFALLERAAASDSTILLEGESGTGKEAVADSIHRASSRASEPFVVVDCASIPANLIESELFGHEKGAFTGAVAARAGAIEEASGGTLFLDEIGELPLELQPKLLRALERRQVKRIGSSEYRSVNLRVLAATNRELSRCVAEGSFRSDLYYRLAVVKIAVPPLRDHLEDVPALAQHFARQFRADVVAADLLTPGVLAAFRNYAWPGNVRELRNAVERLLALGDLATLPGSAGAEARPAAAAALTTFDYSEARREAIDRFEQGYCRALLDECGGVVARAAERAGISRQMFHRLLRKHDVAGD